MTTHKEMTTLAASSASRTRMLEILAKEEQNILLQKMEMKRAAAVRGSIWKRLQLRRASGVEVSTSSHHNLSAWKRLGMKKREIMDIIRRRGFVYFY
jgi:hypothetical protein